MDHMRNLLHAIHQTTHRTSTLCSEIAMKMGMSYQVLSNKTCETNTENQLTIPQLIAVTSITDDLQIIHALAAMHGCTLVEKKKTDPHLTFPEALLNVGAAIGVFYQTTQDALADGVLTSKEYSQVRSEHVKAVKSLNEVGLLVEEKFEAGRFKAAG